MKIYILAAITLATISALPALAGGVLPSAPDLDAPTLTALVSGIVGTFAVYRTLRKNKQQG